MQEWFVYFHNWYIQNKPFINKQTLSKGMRKFWYTHKNLRAACSHLINAILHQFRYINDPEIPKKTNELESYFMHLKDKFTLHKWLRLDKRKNSVKWYSYFKSMRGFSCDLRHIDFKKNGGNFTTIKSYMHQTICLRVASPSRAHYLPFGKLKIIQILTKKSAFLD